MVCIIVLSCLRKSRCVLRYRCITFPVSQNVNLLTFYIYITFTLVGIAESNLILSILRCIQHKEIECTALLSVAINSIFCDFYIIVRPGSHCVTRLFDSESYSKIWLVNRRGAANAPRIPLPRESILLRPQFFPVKSVWRCFSTEAHAVRLPEYRK